MPFFSRYRSLLSGALARYFPRTTAYLRAEREAAAPPSRKAAVGRARKGAAKGKAKKPDKPASKGGRPGAATGLYGATPLPVNEAQSTSMREQVAAAVAAGVVSAPSDEQWAMILGRRPLTRVFAGAGSGKSTTLVLRVVFMLCHLGIEPGRLTVISFTNASCAQLRDQLQKTLAFWQFPFDEAQARECVRTFHSAMGVLAKRHLGNPAWFEQLDERAPGEPDNPLAGGRLRPAQQRLLKTVYQHAYAVDEGFRDSVRRLLELPPLAAPGEGRPPRAPKAPMQAFRLAGEFSQGPLFEALHSQAGFIESLALAPTELCGEALSCPPRERCFIQALAVFSRHLREHLAERGMSTFNAAFETLTTRLEEGEALPLESLAPLSHLLIDEFQDVSPQIVRWLRAVHGSLARRGEVVSLMAVGDDWQSIYGWRGSSPELFMDFDRHFPCKGKTSKSEVLTLATNYRSIEPIIRDGETVLDAVAFKQAKQSRAFKATAAHDHGVRLVTGFDSRNDLPRLLDEIRRQCAHVARIGSRERHAVLLLSRRNEPLQAIRAHLDDTLPVQAYTIHRAKGLQGEVAIIVDDCTAGEPHPLRNALYAHCGFFRNSYDQAMADEALRLAYVAITRGVSRVLWFTGQPQGATRLLHTRR